MCFNNVFMVLQVNNMSHPMSARRPPSETKIGWRHLMIRQREKKNKQKTEPTIPLSQAGGVTQISGGPCVLPPSLPDNQGGSRASAATGGKQQQQQTPEVNKSDSDNTHFQEIHTCTKARMR